MSKSEIKTVFRDLCEEYYHINYWKKDLSNYLPAASDKLIRKALDKAGALHRGQFRKGMLNNKKRRVPYICHPLSAALLLTHYTGDREIITAALLHDTIEDTDYSFARMKKDFGERVAKIVKGVTEDKSLEKKLGKVKSWKLRKKKYIENLKKAPRGSLVVAAADKIHNLHSLITAYGQKGDDLWKHFNAGAAEIIWFYGEVLKVLQKRLPGKITEALAEILREAKRDLKKYL